MQFLVDALLQESQKPCLYTNENIHCYGFTFVVVQNEKSDDDNSLIYSMCDGVKNVFLQFLYKSSAKKKCHGAEFSSSLDQHF
jgi:hypothetical protein